MVFTILGKSKLPNWKHGKLLYYTNPIWYDCMFCASGTMDIKVTYRMEFRYQVINMLGLSLFLGQG